LPITRLLAALALFALVAACASSPKNLYGSYEQSWGMYVSHDNVNTFCLSPKLRTVVADFEGHFRRKVVVSSGYRDPFYNDRVGGADGSYHMKCMAVDFFIPGVSKRDLIRYAMRNGRVGGLGCYPGKGFIHVDVRQRPRGWRQPVTFGGC
jgi:zinc D-Ala-D-Ala carboxypeptidase